MAGWKEGPILLTYAIDPNRIRPIHLLNAVYMWTKGINKMVRYSAYLPFDSVTSEYFPMADPTTTYSHILLVPYFAFGVYLGEVPSHRI